MRVAGRRFVPERTDSADGNINVAASDTSPPCCGMMLRSTPFSPVPLSLAERGVVSKATSGYFPANGKTAYFIGRVLCTRQWITASSLPPPMFTTRGKVGGVVLESQKGSLPQRHSACRRRCRTRAGSAPRASPLQFADGVLLLLLIGQLEGFFLHLKEFYLTPTSPAEMLHNVTLALELLKDEGLLSYPINPEDIVNKDTKSTLRVLYSLFRKHKLKENADSTPRGSPN